MKKIILLLTAFSVCTISHSQEIEKTDKFPSGYINGTYMNKYKTIDGVLYAVGYEGTKDWVLVRYPAGSTATSYTVHENCRRIARGAFQGAVYLQEIYIPEAVSFIGDNSFDGCTSLRAIYYDEVGYSNVRSAESSAHDTDATEVARYDLQGRPCSPTTRGVQIIVYSDFTTRTIISD